MKRQRARASRMPMPEYKAWLAKQFEEYEAGPVLQWSSDEEIPEIDDEARYAKAIGNDLFAS